ncbi:hypothetical protein ILUMI_27268, partial [Ignelater luminosus]
ILYENGVNGILADEMGLGKTIQIIALISHLYERKVEGPYLIIAPLIVFHGSKEELVNLRNQVAKTNYKLNGTNVKPVVITSFEVPMREGDFLSNLLWQYMIVDEGHRLKNAQSRLTRVLKKFKTINRLLLTGTPLQNNLTELWALLNFILPEIFVDMDTFASVLLLEDMEDSEKIIEKEQTSNIISTIHSVLAPFMLRRIKSEVLGDLVPKKEVVVYCPLTKLQFDLCHFTLDRNVIKLKGKNNSDDETPDKENESVNTARHRSKRRCVCINKSYTEPTEDDVEDLFYEDNLGNKNQSVNSNSNVQIKTFLHYITLQSPMMMLKKIVDHPYLVQFPLKPNSDKKELLIDEQLVTQSGKMLVLDAMLKKLKERGHKVLIFSTLVMLLDLLEEYVLMRKYKYCRLDGLRQLADRDRSIDQFNTDPEVFIFLISTRAGGLGLNLTAADTVILFDRDWNPQVDIQAQDRCHRIGQTKPVMVYSLITKNTIDERILRTSNVKRRLERVIIKNRQFRYAKKSSDERLDCEELLELLKSQDSLVNIHTNGYVLSDADLEQLLDRSELYKQLDESKWTEDTK